MSALPPKGFLLPAAAVLQRARALEGAGACWQLPTLGWLGAAAAALRGYALAGVGLALLLLAGVAPLVVLVDQLPHVRVCRGRIPHDLLDGGGARGGLGSPADSDRQPLPRVLGMPGFLHPVPVQHRPGRGVPGGGHIEDARKDRLLGPERLVHGCRGDAGLEADNATGTLALEVDGGWRGGASEQGASVRFGGRRWELTSFATTTSTFHS